MTRDDIRGHFEYEPQTGMLRKKSKGKPYPWRGIGKNRRYLATQFKGETLYLHRAVWLYHYGSVPDMLDHINGDPQDNRVENLRPCSNAQNQYNSGMKVNNRSGYKGVVFHPKCVSRPWQAKIVFRGKVVSLGYYATPELAAAAYAAGAKKYAKEFARIA